MRASTPLILRKSRMRRRARTDLCGGRSVMSVPTATVIDLSTGLVPRNALVLIEFDADLPNGLATRPYWRFHTHLNEESHRFFSEHLRKNRPQMTARSSTIKVSTVTKQIQNGLLAQG